MLHTLLITHRIISKKMYDEIYRSLEIISKNRGVNLYKSDYGYKTNALKDNGFTEVTLTRKIVNNQYKQPYMQLAIQLNPTKLLGKDIIELTEEEDLWEVGTKFNEILESIHLGLCTFNYWTLNRIDYSINIKTPYVKEYIELFHRADIPYRFEIPYHKQAKTRKHKEGSFYIFKKSTIINFYDKENERLNNSDIATESAKNILRLEIQCKKAKTNAMKYKYNFDIKYLGYFLSEELSLKVIGTYFDKTIGTGDFYKLDKAIKLVEVSNHNEGMKAKLINILKQVSSSRSVWKARNDTSYSKESFNKYIKELRALNINPITIPRRWEIAKLKNIDIATDRV